ncbi:bifunctional oligoribonuclease/PAP phosphatase NrnA [bacterium]|nr:bifunctional oligoribonuclease/PAP phosphatase NrnA [bacterium]
MLSDKIQKISNIIDSSQNILITTHRQPDGDAVGSLLALQNYLLNLGKKVDSFCIDPVASNFAYLNNIKLIKNDLSTIQNKYDVAFILDCGDLYMTKIETKLKSLQLKYGIINIDHHHTNPQYGKINVVINRASSTAEIIYLILKTIDAKINPNIATALLTGIITDTNNFTNLATTKQSIESASSLLEIGADIKDILNANVYNKTIDILKLWGIVLKRMIFDEKLSMVTTAVFKEDLKKLDLDNEASEGISNYMNNLSHDIKFSLLLKEADYVKVKGSLRTTRDDIDVSAIAKTFGGGGHQKAAGFEVDGKIKFKNGKWNISNN